MRTIHTLHRLALAAAVSLVASAASAQSIQLAGDVFNNTTAVTGTPASPWAVTSLWIGKTTNTVGSVVAKGGATINATGFISVGSQANTSGLLRMSDVGTSANAFYFVVGNFGQGRFELLDGARIVAQQTFDIGSNASGNGAMVVRGAGSLVRTLGTGTTTSTMAWGAGTVGDLSIEDGGGVDMSADLSAAYLPNGGDAGSATIRLSGVGSRLLLAGKLYLGQNVSGSALLSLGAHTSVSAGGGYAIGKTGVVELSGGTFGLGKGILSTSDGVISGYGTVTGMLATSATASINVAAGKELRFVADKSADQLINRGRIENFGGTLTLALPASNQVGSQIVGRDAKFQLADRNATTPFNNIGQIALVGGSNDIVGPISNSSKILVDGNSVVTFEGSVANNQELRVNAGSRAIFLGSLSGNGVIGGGATLAAAQLAPATAGTVATMSFGGDLALQSTASLSIDLGGASAGNDRLTSAGAASLAGTLDLTLISGYVPTPYATHRILDAASRTGRFATLHGVQLSANQSLAVTYDVTGVSVTAALPGDADLSRKVEFADLLALARSYNKTATDWSSGDFTGDSSTSFDDLLVLARHYGQATAPVSGFSASFQTDWALAQTLVPEPTIVVGVVVAAGLVRRRW